MMVEHIKNTLFVEIQKEVGFVLNFASIAYTRSYFAQIYNVVTMRKITLNSVFQRSVKR